MATFNILYLKKFNNYYNRRLKLYSTAADYIDNSESCFFNPSVDFNENDGILTRKTANFDSMDFVPDYAVVLDADEKTIASRWYIVEMKKERNGQYTMTFKRDVIADFYNIIRTAPMFVHKGNLQSDNPLIFNNEGITVNQIKTSETLLQDKTKTAWIVGYVGNDGISENKTITYAPNAGYMNLGSLPIVLNDEANPAAGGVVKKRVSGSLSIKYTRGSIFTNDANLSAVLFSEVPQTSQLTRSGKNSSYAFNVIYNYDSLYKPILESFTRHLTDYYPEFKQAEDTYFEGKEEHLLNVEEFNEIQQLNGQIVYSDITQKHYRMNILFSFSSENKKEEFGPTNIKPYSESMLAVLDTITSNIVRDFASDIGAAPEGKAKTAYSISYQLQKYEISLTEVQVSNEMTLKLSAGHCKLEDAPYSMFAIPFDLNNLALAVKIGTELSTFIYDMQILPYCPRIDIIGENNEIIDTAAAGIDYDFIKAGENNVSYILWCKTSSNTFIIQNPISINTSDAIELKVANECDMYRLCSPNYNGAFEFSAAKNLGVEFFEVSYTYKPYSPYIQVNPNFKNLYGGDFNDARGLICNGDFSIATLNDQWKTYQINNKNYENIFNAQIKTMDKNNALSLTSNIISSAVGAGAAGVGIGSLTGNVAGGITAGVGSLAGGIADTIIGQSMYQNNRQLQKDMFEMNLQNIKARPDTLNKISAYNINNKYFPFIEYYTCTDIEKEAFKNKIKYEAMTVKAIGNITQYEDPNNAYNFFKASPIILEDIAEDYHVADNIATELEKGIYL